MRPICRTIAASHETWDGSETTDFALVPRDLIGSMPRVSPGSECPGCAYLAERYRAYSGVLVFPFRGAGDR
jgi:hypothetical protein